MFKKDSTIANPKNRTDTAKPDQHQYGLGPVRMTNAVPQQQRKARTHYLVKDADIPDIIIDNRHRKKYTKLGFLGEVRRFL
jgi:hypothetical protein